MHAIHPRDIGTLLRRLRPCARLAAGVVAVSALTGVCALPASAGTLPSPTPGMTSFAAGDPIVFIEQGIHKNAAGNYIDTQLYTAVQTPGTGISFNPTQTDGVTPIPIVNIPYNAMGFNLSDMYLYAFKVNSTTLLRIGSDGSVQTLGAVSGLPASDLSSAGLNAGAFGDSSCTLANCQNILFVREGSASVNTNKLWEVDITTMSATALTLSQSVPNTADLAFSQGYLWSVYSTGTGAKTVTVYRINPVNGHVDTFNLPATDSKTPTTSAIINQSYGAQWTYGNGNIGIAGNTTGVAYQIHIDNPSGASPTFTIVSAVKAPTSSQNDGAAYPGAPVDMAITKTAVLTGNASTGYGVTYTLTVKNNSANVYSSGSTVTDPLPAGLTVDPASLPAGCAINAANVLSCTVGPLKGGDSIPIPIIIQGTLPGTASGTITNKATVTGNEYDPDTTNNTSSATVDPKAPVVRITKTADPTAALPPGGTVTYTVTVTNTGVADASGTTVTDKLPQGIVSATWYCSASGGAACASGSGSDNGNDIINQTLTQLPGGGVVTYKITATAATSGLPAVVTNTATATPPGSGLCEGTCSAEVSNPSPPVVSITKKSYATGPLAPGDTVRYKITVANTGASDAGGTLVSDPLPPGIASAVWRCTAYGGAACPAATGSGDIRQTLTPFPPGTSVVYRVRATVAANNLPANVVNTATVNNLPPGGKCADGKDPPCNDSAPNSTVPIVQITKTSNPTTALTPGGTVTYTVTVTNTSGADASSTTVTDKLPQGIDSATVQWSCSGTACPNPTSGSGVDANGYIINQTLGTFPAGGQVKYTITAKAAASGLPDVVINTATAKPPSGGVCADGSPLPCSADVTNPSVPIVHITKTADSPAALTPGGTVTYKVIVQNAGTVDAPGTVVSDPLPVGIASATWHCSASGGAACANGSSTDDGSDSSGNIINQVLTTFPAKSYVIYTITATAVTSGLPAVVTNTATATPPTRGVCEGTCSSTVTNPATPRGTPPGGSGTTPVPALDARALALLAALLAGLAWFSRRKMGRR